MRTTVIAVAAVAAIGCTQQRERPNLVGQDVRIRILHTSDIHSRLFPYNQVPNRFDEDFGLLPANQPFGGIARISSIVKAERSVVPRSLWLDFSSAGYFIATPSFASSLPTGGV